MMVSNAMPVAAPGKPAESGHESAATGAEDFASALLRLLGPQSPDGGSSGEAASAGSAATGPAPAGDQPPQESLPATVTLVSPGVITPDVVTTPVSAEVAADADADTHIAGTPGAATARSASSAAPTPTIEPTVVQTAMPAGTEAQALSGGQSPRTAQTHGPMAAAVTASAAIHREADAGQGAPTGVAGVEVAPTASVGAPAQSAPPTTGAPAPVTGSAVTGQVFPPVTNLASRGDGRHSITLRLHPADLGEVRVTVTVKNGAVDVTMAAGTEARQALRSGSGELRSLLELAGAATGNVVVRDLPGTSAATPSSGLPSTAGDPHGAGTSADADARTGADPDGRREPGERARDGTSQHGLPGRPDGGAVDPVPHTIRDVGTPASLDLTI